MTDQPKKLSRRDALKILGAAAGATVLANLPSKWTKPELATGVLPAHAATSNSVLRSLTCAADVSYPALISPDFNIPTNTFNATISSATAGIVLKFVITHDLNVVAITSPASPGTAITDASGVATLPALLGTTGPDGHIYVTFSFNNPADGTGSCTQQAFLNIQ